MCVKILREKSMGAMPVKRKRRQKNQEPPIRYFKIGVIGSEKVGKTELFKIFVGKPELKFTDTQERLEMMMDDYKIVVMLWEPGDAYYRFRNVSLPYRGTQGFILLFDISNSESLSPGVDDWITEISRYCPDTPAWLVANKIDLGWKFAKKCPTTILPKFPLGKIQGIFGPFSIPECIELISQFSNPETLLAIRGISKVCYNSLHQKIFDIWPSLGIPEYSPGENLTWAKSDDVHEKLKINESTLLGISCTSTRARIGIPEVMNNLVRHIVNSRLEVDND